MKLQPYWITGFVDGEGSFGFSIFRNKGMRSGFQIQGEFTVVQHQRSIHPPLADLRAVSLLLEVLHALKDYFGCGSVTVNNGNRYHYRVKNNEQLLQIIIPFFDKYPLRTSKKVEFDIFKQLCKNIKNKKHLNPEGFEEMRLLVNKLSDLKKID